MKDTDIHHSAKTWVQLPGVAKQTLKLRQLLNTHGDVLIDFSSPESAVAIAEVCAKKNVGLVAGTTGLNTQQLEKIRRLSQQIPCLVSPNMSVGVNVMFSLVSQMAQMLGNDFDIEIVETHHRFKKDAPSGTALKLAEKNLRSYREKVRQRRYLRRHGITDERPVNQNWYACNPKRGRHR